MSIVSDHVHALAAAGLVDSVGYGLPEPTGVDRSGWVSTPRTDRMGADAGVDGGIRRLAESFADGQATSAGVVEAILSRVESATMAEVGWVQMAPDALEQARASDERRARGQGLGPLDGIPIAVKDLVDVRGLPTMCGSRHGGADPVPNDAASVARLRALGAVLVGKTTTHEYAFGGTTPPTRNPWDPGRIPGGSSGGSGAVVSAGYVPGALGTDTAGSVRIPASMCGTVGFMGTGGVVPVNGVAALAWSLDTVGVLARSVLDAAIMQGAISGRDLASAAGDPALSPRVGVPWSVLDPVHPGVRAAFDRVVAVLAASGVEVVEVHWPDEAVMQAVGFILMMVEAAEFHRDRMRAPELFDPEVAELLRLGGQVPGADYARALRARSAIAHAVDATLADTPILLTPTVPCLPAPYGSGTFTDLDLGTGTMPLAAAHTRYPLLANLAGTPAGSVPCGLVDGVPVGVQVVGRRGADAAVLRAMAAVEGLLADAGAWHRGAQAP